MKLINGLLMTILFVFIYNVSSAQNNGDSTKLRYPINNPHDPTQNNKQSFDLGDPSSVQKTIVYDPVTGKYIFKETIGDLDYRPGSMMTLEEYTQYQREKQMSDYWKEKVDSQTKEEQGLIPPIKINDPIFANIFGSDEINIRPEGSIEISLGVNSSRYDNPQIPEKDRRMTMFDFDQNIQLNIVGEIGTKLKLGASYNTQASFNFDNVTKLEWTGNEDQIIQKIEAGNVEMPLETSLIEGSQTLFGVKTKMRFGRLTVDAIASTSRGQKNEINIKGGAQIKDFELKADEYEANRHYFLNYYHREHYDEAMKTVPIINSLVDITRIEVWVTNQSNQVEETRNVLAFTDLGEAKSENWSGNPGSASSNELPDNYANGLYNYLINNSTIRGFNNAVSALETELLSPGPFKQSVDYEKLENARKLSEQEFTYNAQLGFISVNIPLNNDEVLGVAYEYTYSGRTYQVGEFSTDGIDGTKALFLKLLKPTITNPKNKLWDLMMKNVYSIGAYQVSQEGFRLDILYNNPENSLNVNFLPYPGLDDRQVIDVVGMDRLNQNNRAQKDGVFDFMPITFDGNRATNGGTINTRNGRIYFSTIEPFGQTIQNEMDNANIGINISSNVVFHELYDSTKIAAQQIPKKNRFYFVGKYESSVSDEIPLNALNVPEGAVVVTAGGIRLQEGVDFTVDYNLGRVKILNSSVLESNADIKISVESNSIFGFQNKSLIGTHLDYRFNPDFNIGATWMMKTEKPITQKVDIGEEPYRNNIVGMNLSYRTDLPFLTKLINFIPTISTKTMSSLTLNAEFAHLIPGSPRAITKEGISYVDDFEGSQSTIDLKNFTSWKLASIPQGQTDLFPEASLKNDLRTGFNRSHLSWYIIDYSTFHLNSAATPKHIQEDPSQKENMNAAFVTKQELFPSTDLALGDNKNLPTMDLTFYPQERGMYNYDTTNTVDADGYFINPQDRWGGIMRSLTTTDFENNNIEYIQFWILDPFNEDQDPNNDHSGGDLYFNLGNLSEDILPDSRKSFESGLPSDYTTTQNIDQTNWARISTQQVVVNAFDNDPVKRAAQDVGIDGYNDEKERENYPTYVSWIENNTTLSQAAKDRLLNDVSNDNYNYYRDDRYDQEQRGIVDRYKRWNGMEGNSPTPEMSANINAEGYSTQATNMPDVEDINNDNNLSETEAYFQYKVSLRKSDLQVGKNYIINTREYSKDNKAYKWYQFRIPVRNPDLAVNGITDFRSIRFMRMFLRSFENQTTLRFAKLEFIRSEWRKFREDLGQPTDGIQVDPGLTSFNIGAVNKEEHDQRQPIPYELPPGIIREIDPSQQYQRQLNEQAMTLEICDLQDGDARAATKNIGMDMVMYKNLEMFLHAEEIDPTKPLYDNDVTAFIRLGTDFKENYYEYEVPLKVTPWGSSTDTDIWPEENNLRIVFDDLIQLKKERNREMETPGSTLTYNVEYAKEIEHKMGSSDFDEKPRPKRMIKIIGNPNLKDVKTIMIGVRNPAKNSENPWKPDDGLDKCVEVWVNELRLTEFDNKGGSAALVDAKLQIADFADINVASSYSGIGWGSIDSRVSERQRDVRLNLDLSANVQAGQLLGDRAKIDIPFLYTYSVGVINPQYDPYNPDVELTEYDDLAERRQKRKDGQNFNERQSFNFTNVRRQKKPGSQSRPWDISNFSLNFGYSEDLHRDFNVNYDRTKIWKGGLDYVYNASPKAWEPFKNVDFMKKSKWWNIIRETNLFLGPKNINVRNNLKRDYNERQIRNNIPNTDFEFDPIYLKNFTWNREFGFQYDITRNLKLDFRSMNNSIFDEAEGQVDRRENPTLYREFQDSVTSQLSTLGKAMRYNHAYNISYNIPFNKIPVLDFITSNVRYSGTYEWNRSNLGMEAYGNTIQNSRSINANAQLNLATLYRKSEFLKSVLDDGRGGRSALRQTLGANRRPTGNTGGKKETRLAKKVKELNTKKETLDKVDADKLEGAELIQHQKELLKIENKLDKKEPRLDKQNERFANKEERQAKYQEKYGKPFHPVAGFFARVLMSVRTVSGTYTQNDGMLLPGFNEEIQFFGTNGKMFSDDKIRGFTIGNQQRNVFGQENGFSMGEYAAGRGYIVDTSGLNTQHTVIHSQSYNIKAGLEPIKDLKIDLTMNRNFTDNSTEFYRFNDDIQDFESQSKFKRTTVTYSTISIGSAFESIDNEYRSSSFDQLLDRRAEVSAFIGSTNPNSLGLDTGYYDGYGASQQDVVVGSFLTTYMGKKTNRKSISPLRDIPLPNWNVSYNGLSKMKALQNVVQNFTLRHGYSSTVTVAGMETNLKAEFDDAGHATARDINNNFISSQQIQNITISERFSPLIGFDATWKVGGNGLITKFEYTRERSAALSLANNQVTEMTGSEYVIGLGYKFSNVKLPIKFRGQPLKASDLNIRFDLSIRDNLTVIRKIVENTTQATAGQKVLSIRSSIDYLIGQNITVSLYYDQMLNTPVIATSYVTGNISSGIRLRFNLGAL
ncbi:MAG: cell surface protein SprA [Brumimicrobium sp.]